MKKAFLVTFVSTYGENATKFRRAVEMLGSVWDLGNSGFVKTTFLLFPYAEDSTAKTIREALSKDIHPFSEGVAVIGLDVNDDSYANYGAIEELVGKCKSIDDVPRNFSRFKTRHEAFLAFELEKPRWVYDDGVNMGISIELDDWCWLPVKRDGIYERSKYEKYLLG